MILKDLIAFLATIFIVSGYLPQIVKGYRTKKLEDLSWGLLIITGTGVSLWSVYGILIEDRTFFIANCFIVLSILTLIVMKIYYKTK